MPTPEEIAANQERLYESASLRDDLNDGEATILLGWGQTQVARIAQDFPDNFDQKARFLRQLIKGINRFVGQREFNDRAGQEKYMSKIAMYLPQLGWDGVTAEDLFAVLPEDKSNMLLNLRAILRVLDAAHQPTEDMPPNTTAPTSAPVPDAGSISPESEPSDIISRHSNEQPEPRVEHDTNPITGENGIYDEQDSEQ